MAVSAKGVPYVLYSVLCDAPVDGLRDGPYRPLFYYKRKQIHFANVTNIGHV